MIIFVTQFILFLLATIFCLIIPGNIIWQKTGLKGGFCEKLVLSLSIGFVFFTILSYVLFYFRIDLLIIPITALFNILWIKQNVSLFKKSNFLKIKFKFNKQALLVVSIFSLGILGQLAVISPSGVYINEDLVFWSAHAHDASWHIALIEEIKKGAPWQNPVFAGEKLVNYHFFSDLVLVTFNKYFGLDLINLYFRFFPLIHSILLGGTVFFLTKSITNSFKTSIWAVFFTYFTGSFGYVVTFLRDKTIGGETIFGSSQVQSIIGNPPQITSSFILLSFLYLFFFFLKKQNRYIFSILLIFASVLIVFKVYAGIVLLSSLLIVGAWQFIRERKFNILLLSITSILVAFILYFPNTASSTSFLIFEPWWYIRTLIVYTNKLNWIDLELRRQTYLSEGNIKRVISIEGLAFLLFLFGNFGMRILGFWDFTKFSLNFFRNYFYQLFVLIISISFIIPMLFLQKGVAGNTIQFLNYSLLLFGILAATTTVSLLNKVKLPIFRYTLIFLIILLSIPTQIGLLREFYSRAPVAKIEKAEIEALAFLKNNSSKDSIILTPPFNKFLNLDMPTLPIWAWFDTSYISAFAARRAYLSDSEQVDIMGYDLNERRNIQKEIFTNIENPVDFEDAVRKLKVNYLYYPKLLKPKVNLYETVFSKIFDNGAVEIWRIT